MCTAVGVAARAIRFVDFQSNEWMRSHAPCRWPDNCRLQYRQVPLSRLQGAASLRHFDIVEYWRDRIEKRRAIPPLIVSRTEAGTYFVHDGNHRLDALQALFGRNARVKIRVGCAIPRPGYCFRQRRFGSYFTYWLEPVHYPEPSLEVDDVPGSLLVQTSEPSFAETM